MSDPTPHAWRQRALVAGQRDWAVRAYLSAIEDEMWITGSEHGARHVPPGDAWLTVDELGELLRAGARPHDLKAVLAAKRSFPGCVIEEVRGEPGGLQLEEREEPTLGETLRGIE